MLPPQFNGFWADLRMRCNARGADRFPGRRILRCIAYSLRIIFAPFLFAVPYPQGLGVYYSYPFPTWTRLGTRMPACGPLQPPQPTCDQRQLRTRHHRRLSFPLRTTLLHPRQESLVSSTTYGWAGTFRKGFVASLTRGLRCFRDGRTKFGRMLTSTQSWLQSPARWSIERPSCQRVILDSVAIYCAMRSCLHLAEYTLMRTCSVWEASRICAR